MVLDLILSALPRLAKRIEYSCIAIDHHVIVHA